MIKVLYGKQCRLIDLIPSKGVPYGRDWNRKGLPGPLRHETGHYHPESPKRLESIYKMLESPEMAGKFAEVKPRFALDEELEMIHKRSYVKMIAQSAGKAHTYLDPDTETSPESYETARLAVGGFNNAIDAVVRGDVQNAFAFVRPPGHHAEADRAADPASLTTWPSAPCTPSKSIR